MTPHTSRHFSLPRRLRSFALLALGSLACLLPRSPVAQVAPHHFSAITILSNQTLQLSLDATLPKQYKPFFDIFPLESSVNLRDWTGPTLIIRTNADTNNLALEPSGTVGSPQGYYRTPTNWFVSPFWSNSGPFAVGTVDRLLADESRTNRYGIRTNNAFFISLWYPAQAGPGMVPDLLFGPRLGQVVAGLLSSSVSTFTNFHMQTYRDAPLATNQALYPVVIYSCGGGGYRRDNARLMQDLASHGFIVVSVDHEDGGAVELQDGTIRTGNRPADSVGTYQSRYQDAQVVLDALESMNADDPRFGGRLDLSRIGVIGWSTGGVNSAQLCLEESRIKVGVLLDPGLISYVTNLSKIGIGKPFLVITGVLTDGMSLYNRATGPAYWLNIHGSAHLNMSDVPLYSGGALSQRLSHVLHTYALSFFAKYLLGEDDHLLDGPSPLYPEVKQILGKQ